MSLPSNVTTQNNKAAQEYCALQLFQFEKWYSSSVIEYLVYHQERMLPVYRSVFLGDTTVDALEAFKNQYRCLNFLRNQFKVSACFISFDLRGTACSHHFIFGVITSSNELLIVNPLGLPSSSQFYQCISGLKNTYKIKNVYLSNTVIQRKTLEPRLVSCGPISVELLIHFSALPIETLLASYASTAEEEHAGLRFRSVDITNVLSNTLSRLMQASSEGQYQKIMCSIRGRHFDFLNTLFLEKTEQERDDALSDFLEKVVFYKLMDPEGVRNFPQDENRKKLRIILEDLKRKQEEGSAIGQTRVSERLDQEGARRLPLLQSSQSFVGSASPAMDTRLDLTEATIPLKHEEDTSPRAILPPQNEQPRPSGKKNAQWFWILLLAGLFLFFFTQHAIFAVCVCVVGIVGVIITKLHNYRQSAVASNQTLEKEQNTPLSQLPRVHLGYQPYMGVFTEKSPVVKNADQTVVHDVPCPKSRLNK